MFQCHRRLSTYAWLCRPPRLLCLLGLFIALPASAGEPSLALRHGEIAPAATFRARLAPDAVATARIRLDRAKVPAGLRALVPLAEYWGICDDAIREEMQDAESQANRQAMADAVNPHNAAITAWLDTWPVGELMSDEAAAFMYLQLGLSEMELFREQ